MYKLILAISVTTIIIGAGVLTNVAHGEGCMEELPDNKLNTTILSSETPPPEVGECEDWVNCNMNSPAFDGICCRICFLPEVGHREWVCYRVSDDIGFPDEVRDRLPQNHEMVLDSDIAYIIDNYARYIKE